MKSQTIAFMMLSVAIMGFVGLSADAGNSLGEI